MIYQKKKHHFKHKTTMRIKETSIEAYRQKIISGTIDNDIAWIYWALSNNEPQMTYTEIAVFLKRKLHSVDVSKN